MRHLQKSAIANSAQLDDCDDRLLPLKSVLAIRKEPKPTVRPVQAMVQRTYAAIIQAMCDDGNQAVGLVALGFVAAADAVNVSSMAESRSESDCHISFQNIVTTKRFVEKFGQFEE